MKEHQQSAHGRRRTGLARSGLCAVLGSAALAGAAGVPAAAVAATPPPGRAYELVSPVQKSGAAVAGVAAAGNDMVAYQSIGAFPGASSNISSSYVSRRTATGWDLTPITPPMNGRMPLTQDQPYLRGVSADMTKAVVETQYPLNANDQSTQPLFGYGWGDLYRWNGSDGAPWTWVSPGATTPETTGANSFFAGGTPDYSHLLFRTTKAVVPGVAASSYSELYEHAGGVTRLVSELPDGTPVTGGFGVTSFDTGISDDGETVVFGGPSGQGVWVRTHTMSATDAETVDVTLSQATANAGTACPSALYLNATRDGKRVWFACSIQLTDDAPSDGGIYEYDVLGGGLKVVAPATASFTNGAAPLGAASSTDGRRFYFASTAKLAPGASATGTNIYKMDDGVLSLAAPLPTGLGNTDKYAVSPDGTKFLMETASAIDPRANGHIEVYLYDGGAPGLTCVSCRADGTPSEGDAALKNIYGQEYNTVNTTLQVGGNVTDDGKDVFFTSADALLPQDTNNQPDAYELQDGKLYLLSSGTDRYGSAFHGASADGKDVYILTHEDLAPQDVDHGLADLYDVRRGGGFPVADDTRHCQGQDCQGPLAAAPVTADPVTDRISGHGDAEPILRADFARRAITATMRKQLAAGKKVSIRVKVNQAGTASVLVRSKIGKSTLTIARGSKKATKASTVSVPIKLSSTAMRRLNAGQKLSVTLSVSFTGVRAADATTLSLKQTKTSKGR